MNTTRLGVAAATIAALALGALPGSATKAQAAYVVTFTQVGPDVVANGSGSLNLSALTMTGGSSSGGGTANFFYMAANSTYKQLAVTTGPISPTSASAYDQYGTIATNPTVPVPTSMITLSATSGSGDVVGINDNFSVANLIVPYGYVSGSALSDKATYANTTISDLGLTPGTYVWSWGTEATADSYTLNIDAATSAVPEPSAAALLLLPMMLTGMIATRRRSR